MSHPTPMQEYRRIESASDGGCPIVTMPAVGSQPSLSANT
jgi:hypothetical protein